MPARVFRDISFERGGDVRGASADPNVLSATAASAGIIIGIAVGATGIGGVRGAAARIYVFGRTHADGDRRACGATCERTCRGLALSGPTGSIEWRQRCGYDSRPRLAAYIGALAVDAGDGPAFEALIAEILVLLGSTHCAAAQGPVHSAARTIGPAAGWRRSAAAPGFAAALTGRRRRGAHMVPLLVASAKKGGLRQWHRPGDPASHRSQSRHSQTSCKAA